MNFKTTFVTAALVAATFASSANAAEATATASGTVIVPIAITAPANLSFGRFARGVGGSVTVSTNNTRTGSGVILSTIGSTPSAARFDVTGDANATYSISIAPSASLSDGVETPNTMALATFSDLTAAGGTSGNVSSGTLGAGGTQSIYVGGTLTVGATQAAGTYNGSVAVTVEYN